MAAKMLGLAASDDFASVAIRAELVAKELAQLEAVLADPLARTKESGFSHLPKRPVLLSPFPDRIFGALGVLQGSERYAGESGVQLWGLVAKIPEAALAPHRRTMVEWMQPGTVRPWTDSSGAFSRLDVTDPVQREIVLIRLERPVGDIPGTLLPAFCKLGIAVPEDAKRRLLAIWRERGKVAAEGRGDRGYDHLLLYLALARMGLKEQAGKVEQRYMGNSFAGSGTKSRPTRRKPSAT